MQHPREGCRDEEDRDNAAKRALLIAGSSFYPERRARSPDIGHTHRSGHPWIYRLRWTAAPGSPLNNYVYWSWAPAEAGRMDIVPVMIALLKMAAIMLVILDGQEGQEEEGVERSPFKPFQLPSFHRFRGRVRKSISSYKRSVKIVDEWNIKARGSGPLIVS